MIRALSVCLLVFSVPSLAAMSQTPIVNNEEEESGSPVLDMTFHQLVDGLNDGQLTLNEVRRAGLEVFTRPLGTTDGFGDGPFDPTEPQSLLPGNRPTLQGNGTFLRVNGLDAQSCNECHTIVSQATIPPTLGIGGVGGLVQNAIIQPTLIDVADSADNRVAGPAPEVGLMRPDGEADFNGRLSNPPFLYGGGGVELLAREMTFDLQNLLRQARAAPAGTITPLQTHGVGFGFLRTEASGTVNLDGVDGIGFVDNEDRRPEDVLIVRPFGRKGEIFTMREFDRGAMRFHFGIEPVEVVGEQVDADRDGVVNEISVAAMTALHIFDVTNPPPVMQPMDERAEAGFATFQTIGCAGCHRPVLETRSRYLWLTNPEVPEDLLANAYYSIDLVEAGFNPSPNGGVYVPLFADLKRHAMGPGLEETFESAEIANDEFTTARLWGVGDTAPYIHDGRALELDDAILAHGGEAQPARDAFASLEQSQQNNLVHFLKRLRTPENPNGELLDPNALPSGHPQPTGVTVSPAVVDRSEYGCYTMTVSNGANMTLDVTYTLDGVGQLPIHGWPALNASGINTDLICVSEGTPLGAYVFTGIRNTLNSNLQFVPVSAQITVVE